MWQDFVLFNFMSQKTGKRFAPHAAYFQCEYRILLGRFTGRSIFVSAALVEFSGLKSRSFIIIFFKI